MKTTIARVEMQQSELQYKCSTNSSSCMRAVGKKWEVFQILAAIQNSFPYK